jgi:hypothetical protein
MGPRPGARPAAAAPPVRCPPAEAKAWNGYAPAAGRAPIPVPARPRPSRPSFE